MVTKYYQGGAFRVGGTLYYGLGDHLGSTSITTNTSGNKIAEMRYTAWGEVRYASGTTPSDRSYTGQRSYMADFGLMFYNARWYDPSLGRFAQADTIVPGAGYSQAWDRYAYVNNNPIIYTDPSGHCPLCVTALAGGVIGGIVGGVAYAGYIAYTGKEFDGLHMALAVGGGALAGGLIGTGVGIAAGLETAGATTAIVTTTEVGTIVTIGACSDGDCTNEALSIVNGANQACGGDACASEAQSITIWRKNNNRGCKQE